MICPSALSAGAFHSVYPCSGERLGTKTPVADLCRPLGIRLPEHLRRFAALEPGHVLFGRLDGVSILEALEFVIVLSFPAALGAGLAHFVVGENARD